MENKKNSYYGLILDPDDPGYKRGWTIRLAPAIKKKTKVNKQKK